jgi:alpha-beta hydrolase superfamily lysophospholipase
MVASPSIHSIDPVMKLPVRQFAYLGSGGLRLAAACRQTAGPPVAVVAFAHGFTSYADAYVNVLRTLVDANILVYTVDHRGHGYSEGKRASLDHIDLMVDDFERLVSIARAEHPDLPLFTLGHSMGGLIVGRHGYRFQEGLAGMIPVSAAFSVGVDRTAQEVRLLVGLSKAFPFLRALGGELPPPSSDDASRPRARNLLSDRGKIRLNMARELYLGGRETLEHAPEWRPPILLQHGTADIVTMPSGSEQAFERASSPDRTLELWPSRHHNLITDEGWEEPVQQIVDWIIVRSRGKSLTPGPSPDRGRGGIPSSA